MVLRQINRRFVVLKLVMLVTLFCPGQASAWWEAGHHVVAILAYDLLDEAEQRRLDQILAKHPRFEEDFSPPSSIKTDSEAVRRWRFGRAGYWPDIARKFPQWNRSHWHYRLGSALVVGDKTKINLPQPSAGEIEVTLDSNDFYIDQAIPLVHKTLDDQQQTGTTRAIALTWMLHLYGDGHQPCHGGSLYVAGVFPDGDRGGNQIKLTNDLSLHAFWDSSLGNNPSPEKVNARVSQIQKNGPLMRRARELAEQSDVKTWLDETSELARVNVYSDNIMNPVMTVVRGLTESVPEVELSEGYIENAKKLADQQAAVAAYRLRDALRQSLNVGN